MSQKKLATISLQGKAYATVPTRIKEFRELCPNGLIETTPNILADGRIMFKTRILKDKANPDSGEGTGHSIGSLLNKKGEEEPKAFEKLETISIGRALAILGFMSSGEVASFEEMEDFLSEKETKRQVQIQQVKEKVDSIKDIDELREYFKTVRGLGIEVDSYVMDKSKQLKEAKKK